MTALRARVIPKYPRLVQGTGGVTVTEQNGVATLGFDYASSELGIELQQAVDTATAKAQAAQDAADIVTANPVTIGTTAGTVAAGDDSRFFIKQDEHTAGDAVSLPLTHYVKGSIFMPSQFSSFTDSGGAESDTAAINQAIAALTDAGRGRLEFEQLYGVGTTPTPIGPAMSGVDIVFRGDGGLTSVGQGVVTLLRIGDNFNGNSISTTVTANVSAGATSIPIANTTGLFFNQLVSIVWSTAESGTITHRHICRVLFVNEGASPSITLSRAMQQSIASGQAINIFMADATENVTLIRPRLSRGSDRLSASSSSKLIGMEANHTLGLTIVDGMSGEREGGFNYGGLVLTRNLAPNIKWHSRDDGARDVGTALNYGDAAMPIYGCADASLDYLLERCPYFGSLNDGLYDSQFDVRVADRRAVMIGISGGDGITANPLTNFGRAVKFYNCIGNTVKATVTGWTGVGIWLEGNSDYNTFLAPTVFDVKNATSNGTVVTAIGFSITRGAHNVVVGGQIRRSQLGVADSCDISVSNDAYNVNNLFVGVKRDTVYSAISSTNARFIDAGGVQTDQLSVTNTVMMPGLPTANPHVVGELWNNAGVVNVSAG